jgi:hypothetical protein
MNSSRSNEGIAERTVEWLIYTCLLGMIPVIARFTVWLVSNSGVEPLAISDLVAFGLVLHSANIHEVTRLSQADTRWRTVNNGFSITFIVVYALLLFTTISPSKTINQSSLLIVTLGLCAASFLLSLSILLRGQAEERRSNNG